MGSMASGVHGARQAGVMLDLDTVVIEARPASRAPDIRLRPGVYEGLRRLRQVVDRVVILVHPQATTGTTADARSPEPWLSDVLGKLEPEFRDLVFATCPHSPAQTCDCAKPHSGLVEMALVDERLDAHQTWHVGGDQESVQVGRGAGLRTIRVGPSSEGHLGTVHRADYEARDLLDAANWILVQAVAV